MKWDVTCLCHVFKDGINHICEFAVESTVPTEPVVG